MKKLKILVLIIILSSCVDNKVITIDGCQYIETTTYSRGIRSTLIHKGNCNNPIHAPIVESKIDTKYDDISHLADDSIRISIP